MTAHRNASGCSAKLRPETATRAASNERRRVQRRPGTLQCRVTVGHRESHTLHHTVRKVALTMSAG